MPRYAGGSWLLNGGYIWQMLFSKHNWIGDSCRWPTTRLAIDEFAGIFEIVSVFKFVCLFSESGREQSLNYPLQASAASAGTVLEISNVSKAAYNVMLGKF